MYENLKKSFFWPKNEERGTRICKAVSCLSENQSISMKWECISMDFVTGLSSVSGCYDSIFVGVDKLTKVAHLILIRRLFQPQMWQSVC